MVQVIGAGYGRTGTASLKQALDLLGFDPCYHMFEVRPDAATGWVRALTGEPELLPELLSGYRATVDIPGCLLWRELMQRYPEAKVLLTVRDPEAWWRSASTTIFRVAELTEAARRAGQDATLPMALLEYLQEHELVRGTGQTEAIRRFTAHNDAVRAGVPADRLLVHEVSQGWAPLCEFLEVPVPAADFPRVNDAAAFQQIITRFTEAARD